MKTLWNKTYWIEKYLLTSRLSGKTSHSDLFDVLPGLSQEINLQKKVYFLLKMYHRKKLKDQLQTLSRQFFVDEEHSEFRDEIHQIFK